MDLIPPSITPIAAIHLRIDFILKKGLVSFVIVIVKVFVNVTLILRFLNLLLLFIS
jgi:hypothetical protein